MNDTKRDWTKIFLKIVLLVSALTTLILSTYLLYRFRVGLSAILVVPWLVWKLKALGVNEWLAYSIAIPVAGVLYYVMKLTVSKDQSQKNIGYALLTFLMVGWCLSMYFMTRNYAYDPKSQKPIKCYAETLKGYEEVSCEFKVHPVYGTKVLPWDEKMTVINSVGKNGLPEIKRVTARINSAFFTPSGDPLVWYYESDGKIELFPGPGIHPQYGNPLKPITPDVVKQILTDLSREQQLTQIQVHQERPTADSRQQIDQNKKLPEGQVPDLNYLKDLADELREINK